MTTSVLDELMGLLFMDLYVLVSKKRNSKFDCFSKMKFGFFVEGSKEFWMNWKTRLQAKNLLGNGSTLAPTIKLMASL